MGKAETVIAIYSRKSRFTGKGESIGNQVELCREYIRNAFGEESADRCAVFEDEGFSGGNLNRPDFRRMMEDVRRRRFRAIVVYRLDRISRNISDFAGLIEELTRLDVSFVSIREQFDTATPMGRAMMYILSVFSQLERETIAERIRDNMHELAKTGRWLGGNTPIGFRSGPVSKITLDGKERKSYKLIPIPEELEIPRLIFDLYTETDSLTAVETELLRRRIKTRQGKDFSRFAVRAILQNPVYMVADAYAYSYFAQRDAQLCFPKESFDGSAGIMAYNRTDQEKGRTTRLLPVSQWIIATGRHPGVVPSRQWIRVQESLERNKSKAYRKPRSNEALLTGLIYCACGERMYPKLSQRATASGEIIYTYVCKMKERSKGTRCSRRNANGNALDGAIVEQLKSIPHHGESVVGQLAKSREFYADKGEQHERQLEQLRAEHTKNEQMIDGLLDSLSMADDSAVKTRVLRRMEELTEQNRQIQNRIGEVEVLISSHVLGEAEFARLGQALSDLRTCMDDMSVEGKREAARTMIRKVIWDGVNAHVVLFGAEEDSEMLWCEDSKCNPITSDFNAQQRMVQGGKKSDWRILDRISADLYLLSWAQNSHVRYAPLYIHSFVLCTPRKILEATQFNQRYRRYEDIQNVPDRLRWLRHSRGLLQVEAARIAGVTRSVYIDIECGITQRVPIEMADKLAVFYGKPREDFLDEFNRFLLDGQAKRIRAYRARTGLSRREYAKQTGIPVRSLEVWENEKKVISFKCWERYFMGRA